MKFALHAVLALFISALLACADKSTAPVDLAITDVTLIDAINPLRRGATVLIDNGRIVDVHDHDPANKIAALNTVNASGQYLIPGLWDFHVHFTFDPRFTDTMAGLFLYHGITNVRDTGGLLEDLLPVIKSLHSAGAEAPNIWYAGPLLDGKDVVYDGETFPGLGIANPTPETARANIASIHEAGASFLKIYEMVSPEVFAAIVEEAQKRNLPVDGHVPLSMRARDVAPHVQSLEHLRNYEMDCVSDPEWWLAIRQEVLSNPDNEPGNVLRSRLHALQRLPAITTEDPDICAETTQALKETITVPTLRMNAMDLHVPLFREDFDQALALTPESVQADWGQAKIKLEATKNQPDTTFAEWSLRRTGALHAAGVPIAAGTDTPIGWSIPGYSLHTELEQYVEVGMTPREALYTATVRPAQFFGLEQEKGQLATGFLADAVLLSDNPLQDIRHTRAVAGVINKGVFLGRPDLERIVITAEQ